MVLLVGVWLNSMVLWLINFRNQLITALMVSSDTIVQINMRVAALICEPLLALLNFMGIFLKLFADLSPVELLESMNEGALRIVMVQV